METVRVAFEGLPGGSAPSSWGQREVWCIGGPGTVISLRGLVPLPPGTTVDDGARVLRDLVRHEAMRTRFTVGAGGSLAEQAVAAEGEVEMEVVPVVDGDGEATARGVLARYDERGVDCVNDWPIRTAMVVDGGVLTHAVAFYNHLAIDLGGLDLLLAQVAGKDPATGRTPREQARWQNSPAGTAQSDRALRRWRTLLRGAPARRFPRGRGGPGVGYRKLLHTSPAAALGAAVLAENTGQGTGNVLLAAYAVAVARLTGVATAVVRLVVHNRFRPDLAGSVGAVSQFGLCAIDTGADFRAVVGNAWRASLHAYKNAYHDPVQRLALLDSVSAERGEQVHTDVLFNDRRRVRDTPATASAEEVRAALGRATAQWEPWPFPAPPGETLYLHVDDTDAGTVFTVCGDTDHLSPEELLELPVIMETVIAEAAIGVLRTC
ncbi:non-ribosomal peptide synthetase [Actinokineospora spheciospongiae]|uniref:Non-ribosomal peptide synthetase n=1 Tax=Actinokineospora spheciospongiae TaxID=909613 RepID=W7IHD5_9PSEU|nr:hypothetical protein [Actinokineospora spheciospongiae]EWC60310.1 non-ribosomal peptide synthetase [Actinokineospora spheciospongiae]